MCNSLECDVCFEKLWIYFRVLIFNTAGPVMFYNSNLKLLYKEAVRTCLHSLLELFSLFVIRTTLYTCMSALPFGYVFSLCLTKKTTMFTVLC